MCRLHVAEFPSNRVTNRVRVRRLGLKTRNQLGGIGFSRVGKDWGSREIGVFEPLLYR